MILKKPYAFLIKSFRLIHLILAVMIGFLLYKTYNIYTFFNRFVNNIYSALDALPSEYISVFMFLITVIIVSFSLAMYLLMKQKKKPKFFYVFTCSYYLIYFFVIIYYFSVFKSMDTKTLSIFNAMVLRDISLILLLPQIPLFVVSLIRGVGFDIRKFNFSKDLRELDLSEKDSEEFEFVMGIDSYVYLRYFRKRIRELRYYVLENKFIFSILFGLLGGIFLIIIIANYTIFNRSYKVNQSFIANNMRIQVNNSYLTNLDFGGNVIEKDKNFLVVNLTFTNNSGTSTVLDLTNYVLQTKSGKIYPTLDYNKYFVDLGAGYSKERIVAGTTSNYILVYELKNKEDLKDKYKLDVINSVEYRAGSLNTNKKRIGLKPEKSFKIKNVGTYKLKDKVELDKSVLNDSDFTLNEYENKSTFTYNYEACIRSNCTEMVDVINADATNNSTLVILKGVLEISNDTAFAKNRKYSSSFFDAFVKVKYDDKLSNVKDVTPTSLKDEYVLEVNKDVENASKVDVLVIVRDKKYTINIR